MTTESPAPAAPDLKLQILPFAKLIESPWNPRKRFDPEKQKTLAASLAVHGQLVAGIVRPIAGGKFEIAAGHRRFRAGPVAGLAGFLAQIRELSDAQFAEILVFENDERDNVHPLEQAEGFRTLMVHAGYDVAKIAARIQRGHDFVYDRLTLLDLVPALKALFLEQRFGLAQALVLAKLSPEDQRKAAAEPEDRASARDSGLWRASEPTLDRKAFPFVAKTAAELEYWISRNLRFDTAAIQLEEQFPETAENLEMAEATGTRVVAITFADYLPPSIERTDRKIFTRNFWKRADGLDGSKTCDYAVIGIVEALEGRGQSFGVCTSRDSCTTHWAARVKELAARKKAKQAGAPKTPAAKAKAARTAATKAKREAAAALAGNLHKSKVVALVEKQIIPGLLALTKAPTKAAVARARERLGGKEWKRRSLESILVGVAIEGEIRGNLVYSLTESYHRATTTKELKAWGFDVRKLLAGVKVATCVYCGCSEENACRLGNYGMGPSCKWVSKDPLVCSKPSCVAAWKAADTTGAAAKVKDAVTAGEAQLSDDDFDDEEA